MPATATLQAEHIGVAFAGLRALHNVDLTVAPGQIVGLIGPNGAGKTTLVNVLSGLQTPTSGRVLLGGSPLQGPADTFRRCGVARTFQGGRLFRALSVRDNLEATAIGLGATRRSARDAADEMLESLALTPLAHRAAGTLPYTDERRVGIARAVMGRPRFLLLDEPAAGMSVHEAHDLQALIARLVAQVGCGVLLIEHNVRMVLDCCAHIVVLDSGEVIEAGPPQAITASERVRVAYMGSTASTGNAATTTVSAPAPEPVPQPAQAVAPSPARPLLEVHGLAVQYGGVGALRGVDLTLDEGDLLMITGPNGAGKSTLMRALAGLVRPRAGRITLSGEPLTGRMPEDIARLGLSMVPEGRQVFGSLTVRENLMVGARPGSAPPPRQGLDHVLSLFPALASRLGDQAGMLSGGQQQMLVIGRALMTGPRLLAIDEPSLGLAPRVTDEVYEALLRLRASGQLTLLIVEQSAARALQTGGRVVMLREGRIALAGDPAQLTAAQLQQAYFGLDENAA